MNRQIHFCNDKTLINYFFTHMTTLLLNEILSSLHSPENRLSRWLSWKWLSYTLWCGFVWLPMCVQMNATVKFCNHVIGCVTGKCNFLAYEFFFMFSYWLKMNSAYKNLHYFILESRENSVSLPKTLTSSSPLHVSTIIKNHSTVYSTSNPSERI